MSADILELNASSFKTLDAAITEGKVPDKDKEFVTSLVKQGKTRWGLSNTQWHWVRVLAQRLTGGSTARVVGDFSGVYDLFQRAAKHLKNPKVRLQTEAGVPLQLYLSGQRSRLPGVVNVTDGGPFENRKWYGRVSAGGEWQPNDKLNSAYLGPVEDLLRQFAKDPAGVAAAYGRYSGLCSFCNRKLADERSTVVGYGPVCASRYNMPWGAK